MSLFPGFGYCEDSSDAPVSWEAVSGTSTAFDNSSNNTGIIQGNETSYQPGLQGTVQTADDTPSIRHNKSDKGDYAESELFVRFKPGISPDNEAAVHSAIGSRVMKDYRGKGIDGLQVVFLPPGLSVTKAVEKYQSRPEVMYAEPNYIRNISEIPAIIPDDPNFASQWNFHNTGQAGGTPDADIDAPAAWVYSLGSQSVVVAVIDSGIDYNHPDLSGNIFTNPGETGTDESGKDKRSNTIDDDGNGYIDDWHGYDFVNHDNDPYDDHGHGTHCAGLIGATGNNTRGIAGINWNVGLLPLKCFNSQGIGYDSDIIDAFLYAGNLTVTITSNSYSGDNYDISLETVINESGMLNICAAGNSGTGLWVPEYPACYPSENLIVVAATDRNDNLAYFSNYNATHVDIAAPGVSILSTIPSNAYGLKSGTSMATPQVAGVAALIQARCPEYTPLQIKERLLENVDHKPGLEGKVLTGGRLNAMKSLRAVASPDSCYIIGPAELPVTIDEDYAAEHGRCYILEGDWTGSYDNTAGIIVSAPDIIIDGQNSTLTGSVPNTDPFHPGIRVTGDNFTVRSITFSGWYEGIASIGVEGGLVENMTFSDMTNGATFNGSSDLIIRNNVVRNNLNDGIFISAESRRIVVADNEVSGNLLNGVEILAENCLVMNNTITNNINGIYLENAPDTVISGNRVSDNRNAGIISACPGGHNDVNITLEDNLIQGTEVSGTSSQNIGIILSNGSSRNTVKGNMFIGNNGGIVLDNSTNNSIYNNLFRSISWNTLIEGTNTGNTWNGTIIEGRNIIDGPYSGGNFWGTTSGTGFSDLSFDMNGDGFCDGGYQILSGNPSIPVDQYDYLPLHAYSPAIEKIGIFQEGNWYLDLNGDGIYGSGDVYCGFGSPGWTAVTGDWNGDGFTNIGIYRDGYWYLDLNGDGIYGSGDVFCGFGSPGWTAVTGDWNGDLNEEIGVYQDGNWYLDYDGNGCWSDGDRYYGFGAPGWKPVVGKWTHENRSKIGIYNGGNWYLDGNGDGAFIPETGDRYIPYGAPDWIQLVGDWNGDGKSEIGIYQDGIWYLDYGGNGVIDADTRYYTFGTAGWTPLTGYWNSEGKELVGVYQDGNWYLDYDGNGYWSAGDRYFGFGAPGWTPITGKWST